jgi:hypothetical protein
MPFTMGRYGSLKWNEKTGIGCVPIEITIYFNVQGNLLHSESLMFPKAIALRFMDYPAFSNAFITSEQMHIPFGTAWSG